MITDASLGQLIRGKVMTLREIKELLEAEVLVGQAQLDKEISTAFGADLMSDVLAFAKPGSLLLTGLTNPQVVRTADVLDIAAIVMVQGKKPTPETIRLAEELGIPFSPPSTYSSSRPVGYTPEE